MWSAVAEAVRAGRLGGEAKVSTTKPNSNAEDPTKHVICVYTYDVDDVADVRRVRAELRKLGVTWRIPYKTDRATEKGLYRVRGHTRISQYFE